MTGVQTCALPIHPNNFAVARAMAGDASDNIDGVKGLGLTTIANRMPFLAEEKECLTGDVFDFCKKQIEEGSKLKLFQNVLDVSEQVHTNYTVMQLSAPNLSFQVLQKVDYALDNYDLYLSNKTDVCAEKFAELIIKDVYELLQEHYQTTPLELSGPDRKSTRLNSSHIPLSRMPSSA